MRDQGRTDSVVIRDPRRSERGFTLVELMISLVISSIIVFFLFTIQGRMSSAFRGQGTVSEINQNLRAARQMLVRDIRMAGYGLSTLGKVYASTAIAGAGGVTLGLVVTNNAVVADGDDNFRSFYADSSLEVPTSISTGSGSFQATTLTASPFAIGDLVVVAGTMASGDRAACIGQISAVTPSALGSVLDFAVIPGSSFNEANGAQCDPLASGGAGEVSSSISVRRLVARAYRLVPTATEATAGYLQMSATGGVLDDWQNMGAGFTNLQIATRYKDVASATDEDFDGDNLIDWYSGNNQTTMETSLVADTTNANIALLQASISIEGRSPFGTKDAVASFGTTAFAVDTQINNNYLGDWSSVCSAPNLAFCGVDLANLADGARPIRYRGEYIYRYSTSVVDLRNMGVGQ